MDEHHIRDLVAEYIRCRASRSEGEILGMGNAGEGNREVVDVEKAADEFLWELGEELDRMEAAQGRAGDLGFRELSQGSGMVILEVEGRGGKEMERG